MKPAGAVTRRAESGTGPPSLANEASLATEVLASLVAQHAAALGADLTTALRATCEQTHRRLSREELFVALLAETRTGNGALVNAVLGEGVLGAPLHQSTAIFVRNRPLLDYAARFRDGRIEEFAQSSPDRDALFRKSLEQAERDVNAATAAVAEAQERLQAASFARAEAGASVERLNDELDRAHAAVRGAREARTLDEQEAQNDLVAGESLPPLPQLYRRAPPWWAVWAWLLRLVLWPRWREPLRLHAAAQATRARARERLRVAASRLDVAEQQASALERQRRDEDKKQSDVTLALSAQQDELVAARSRLHHAGVRVDRLRTEREKFACERKSAFVSELSTLADRDRKGKDVLDLAVAFPAKHLSTEVTLIATPGTSDKTSLDATWAVLRGDADACVIVKEVLAAGRGNGVPEVAPETSGDAKALRLELPTLVANVFSVEVTASADGPAGTNVEPLPCTSDAGRVGELLELLVRDRSLVIGARAAAGVRACITRIAETETSLRNVYLRRIAALEEQRIPETAEFRARQVSRMEKAIVDGAGDVVSSAESFLSSKIDVVKREYKSQVESAKDRSEVEGRAAAINEGASARLSNVLEEMSERVAGELARVTETLETWALEEIHARFQLSRRLQVDSFDPVASDITRDDFQGFVAEPVLGVMAAFEKQRVGYGLGGVAAGAVLGTLIMPVIGTAIGAFIGTFAGFLKGVDSLKRDCVAKLDQFLDGFRQQVTLQLMGRKEDVSALIRTSLDAALAQALERLVEPIERLRSLERKTLEEQSSKLQDLARLIGLLHEHDARLAALMSSTRVTSAEPELALPTR